jgi:lipopolysaccharide/colanic/teichoic acid biosynthesis glycosyltransferase
MDLVLAVSFLLLAAPAILAVAVAIRVHMGTPVLFCQERAGKGGRPFVLLKFRTMSAARNKAGNLLPDGERITRLGHFLREASLDELPQLWNVVRGEMSLVGPRPLLLEYLPRYSPRQARRHEVMPGVTGWAQINGRNALTWEEKLSLDVWYVENWSLVLDARILGLTFGRVCRRQDISPRGQATMAEFMGSGQRSE